MDVASTLSHIEHDVSDLSQTVRPLLEHIGRQQQRLLTLLALMQGIYFTYCQSYHVLPPLLALIDEQECAEAVKAGEQP